MNSIHTVHNKIVFSGAPTFTQAFLFDYHMLTCPQPYLVLFSNALSLPHIFQERHVKIYAPSDMQGQPFDPAFDILCAASSLQEACVIWGSGVINPLYSIIPHTTAFQRLSTRYFFEHMYATGVMAWKYLHDTQAPPYPSLTDTIFGMVTDVYTAFNSIKTHTIDENRGAESIWWWNIIDDVEKQFLQQFLKQALLQESEAEMTLVVADEYINTIIDKYNGDKCPTFFDTVFDAGPSLVHIPSCGATMLPLVLKCAQTTHTDIPLVCCDFNTWDKHSQNILLDIYTREEGSVSIIGDFAHYAIQDHVQTSSVILGGYSEHSLPSDFVVSQALHIAHNTQNEKLKTAINTLTAEECVINCGREGWKIESARNDWNESSCYQSIREATGRLVNSPTQPVTDSFQKLQRFFKAIP